MVKVNHIIECRGTITCNCRNKDLYFEIDAIDDEDHVYCSECGREYSVKVSFDIKLDKVI